MAERTNILTVEVSVFNEEDALPLCRERLTEVLERSGRPYALLFVNDGSSDGSAALLDRFAAEDARIRVLHFSRNFGHEAAMIAFDEGFDVISMVRTANRSAGLIKNITSAGFYGVMNALSGTRFEKNASDFFGISARAAEVLRHDYRERVRFLRGYVQSLGFRSTTLSYEAAERAAGHSKYSIRKLFRFSMNTIMSFSDLPLRLGIYAGIALGALGVLLLLYSIFTKLRFGAPDGYTTIIVVICFMFSMLFLILGIMGQYIGVLFQEVKGRPIYIVAAERGARAAEHGVLTDKKTEA